MSKTICPMTIHHTLVSEGAVDATDDSGHTDGKPRRLSFDSDSFTIYVDNCASRCMTNDSSHFISPLKPTDRSKRVKVKGISNFLNVEGEGTIRWRWEDDQGRVHQHIIRGALYVPNLPFCLLSPQHWAKQADDNYPRRRGTYCGTYDDACELHWDQRQYRRTLRWDPATNTASFRSASGATTYRVFTAAVEEELGLENDEHVCYQTNVHLVSDDEGNDEDSSAPTDEHSADPTLPTDDLTTLPTERSLPLSTDGIDEENLFDLTDDHSRRELRPPPNVIEDEDEALAADNVQAELLRWHHRLGHLSFNKIRLLSSLGILPRRLTTVRPPKCPGCIYGAMTKRPWRTKAQSNKGKIYLATKPGDCVSVDQLESNTPGFIAQLKGSLTKQRYRAATIFVDHYSRLSYVYLQRGLTSDETLKAKRAFEAYARSHNVQIKHYHCDNGRFSDNAFIDDVTKRGQTISYCGVNAHFQNGIAEKRIRDLQERARKMLLHAKSRWPSAIELNLWPYAVRTANHLMATLPDKDDGSCPLERFASTTVSPRLKANHTFGCPIYALHNRLQSDGRIPKWNSRARLGVYLGPSPRHASSVSLVLNLNTGLVSPQFHVQHDDFFETVRPTAGHGLTSSLWQQLAGLRKGSTASPSSEGATPSSEGGTAATTTEAIPEGTTATNGQADAPIADTANENDDAEPPNASDGSTEAANVRRSGRSRRLTLRMEESQQLRAERHVAYSAQYDEYYDVLHEDDYQLQDDMEDPIAFLASSSADTMYFHQAMKEPDAQQFRKAIVKEINAHIDGNHWELVPRSEVPEGARILPAVWSMKRKRDIKTRQVYKHKARLNIDGSKQRYGIDYFETHAPVVTWVTILILLVLSIINRWHTRQIDFVQAYPQAPIEFDMYMELPKGIETRYGNGKTHVLKLLKNLYGQRQAHRVWAEHLSAGLQKIGFVPSTVDPCMFYRDSVIFVVYVDDGIFLGPNSNDIDKAIAELKAEGFDIEDQGDIADYLGVNVERVDGDKIKLSQPHLIDEIIRDVNLSSRAQSKSTPAAPTKILHRDQSAPAFNHRFNYRSVIGKLNFLEKSTCPDISYAVHQAARFSSDPRKSHGEAVERIAQYLKSRRNEGLILDPQSNKSIECYADADFSGNYIKHTAADDPSTAKSRTGYIITFAGVPIIWKSKLQTQVALSSCEAEYIALSDSLLEVKPMMALLDEMKSYGFDVVSTEPTVYCKAFEDNSGALELARTPKLRPRTKHINIKYHHFRDHVRSGKIKIYPVKSEDQLADVLTKPLPQNLFLRFRKLILRF